MMYQDLKWKGQPLIGDRRAICEYQDEDHVPYVMREALTTADVTPYLDKGTLVTFAGQVPLDVILYRGEAGVLDYIRQHWLPALVDLGSAEYRAIGASFDEFRDKACGLVHLQVTCELLSL